MKVKVGNKIYDAEDELVMIILSNADKDNIRAMSHECTKYCAYPTGTEESVVVKFMDVDKVRKARKVKPFVIV